ncbi:pyruvate kinase [Piptocephalis cylindrospora]|uniref:Pyruvate kinase n=1 Tax=Piptocephalis cylindrospora TaxID=1907219 RepID=A0A4P9Y0F1_9FUNG|nr:pyruvate kinase [Piptocephalis cylindrospora]|eukprot:RKP12208.1 pyruvate kinase [Piptocephalis cylindrospora]
MSTPNDQITTRLEWLAKMDVNIEPGHVRKSGIICTIGPKTNSVEAITELRKAGLNIVRMNFSHGSHEYHGSVIANARKSVEEWNDGRTIAIALDTKGPEIRTGLMANDTEVPIPAGHEMLFTTDEQYAESSDAEKYFVDYANLPKVIEAGKHIFVDDGILSFEVLRIVDDKTVHVRSLNAGKLASRKGVNLPGTDVDLPALSEKDKNDLRFGVEQGVDMIFASFIRRGEDVRDIRRVLGEKGKHIKIVCKIENLQGVANFPEILAETDGVMIARGDLGIEIPCQRVFIAQKAMIAQCNLAGKPVVCATQMLESMTSNPRPTRAEVSDVSNAILDGADCVMLSGETAKGSYPVETVAMMDHVCSLAESVLCYPPLFNETRALQPRPTENTETIAASAVNASIDHKAGAIIVLTTTGNSARLISKYRPSVPIITITRHAHVARQAHLSRGCFPFVYSSEKRMVWQEDVEARIQFAVEQGVKHKLLNRGDAVIAVQGWKGGIGHTNTMRIIIA